MCNAAKHAFKEKSAKLLILLSLKTIYFRTFQSETPCITILSTPPSSMVHGRGPFYKIYSTMRLKIQFYLGTVFHCNSFSHVHGMNNYHADSDSQNFFFVFLDHMQCCMVPIHSTYNLMDMIFGYRIFWHFPYIFCHQKGQVVL